MNRPVSFLKCAVALSAAALVLPVAQPRAEIIADSVAEFSGEQGLNGWQNGYRVYSPDLTENYDPEVEFVPFWAETWTGAIWDLNPEAAAPWTSQGPESLHPNGDNNGEEHWNIRRWTASELTATTPIAITWTTRKENTGGGNGVTGALYQNGVKIDSAIIPFNDGTGVTRTFYVNAVPTDRFDLVLSPAGTDGSHNDGSDGSFNSMRVDNALPAVPRQPDGGIFIPVNSVDSDGDGLADFWEDVFVPGDLTAMNGTGDRDNDGVTNRQEQDRSLDPTDSDSDNDGLLDGVETNTGIFVSASDTGTNPRIPDTDGDGRSDGDEVVGAIKSNPTVVDTDNDGFSDGSEVATGHDPSDENNNQNTTPIANSETGFSGVQGQNDWQHGYRNVSGGGAIVDYAPSEFTPFPGGEEAGDWDGVTQVWTGAIWDLNTAAAGPWTELGPLTTHPSGPSPLHWVTRRWTAATVTAVTPMALRYHVRKTNTGCGNGVTAAVFVNGELGDSVSIAGNDGTGVTRTYYANIAPNDVVDVVLSPRGANNDNEDGCDSSAFSLVIDPTLPAEPRQPDGSVFIPANANDSDGDGLPDAWERLYAEQLTTLSRTGDHDSDGLSDLGEYNRDSDPTKADTDGDGLNDLVETNTGVFVSATDTGSSPKRADTDGDTLADLAEVNGTPRTDPNKADSDTDGFTDPQELQAGTDPNSAADNPLTFVIANSQAEFSGVQGQNGWFNGYRNYTLDGGATDYNPAVDFLAYAGGSENLDPWDGFSQMWTGSGWDLNTTASGPWTEQGSLALHPNGVNSAPNEEHWVIRRWVASEVTADIPVAIIWNVRKNGAGGGGVTGSLHVNGVQVDAKTIAGTDTTGETRRFYLNLKKDDVVDLAVTPEGLSERGDGSDGSSSWFWVDTRLPREPRQPDGTLFIPAGSGDSDADGLADFWERVYASDLATLTGTGDNDGDGLVNTGELSRDSNPLVADTDGDGLGDNAESNTGTFASASNTGTNPRQVDTDGDGLADGAEVTVHTTDPTKADTDEDSFSDGAEVASGHDPKDADSNPNTSVIANSLVEFSGVQGQDGWRYGYRNQTADGGGVDYTEAQFIEFAGGDGVGDWDGVTQQWTGTLWDLETAAAGPWTELGPEASHPNGPSPMHWTVRRWVASELAAPAPLALRYHVRKTNPSGNGVTAAIHINGVRVDSIAIAGNNSAGVTRTFYAMVNPGDKIDLVHSPVGPGGQIDDGADGSALWLQVDTVLPPNPTQPDGTPFVPGGGGGELEILSVEIAAGKPVIVWQSEAGQTFTVQASSTLQPDSWSNIATSYPSGGAQTSYTDNSTPLPPHRFYRVLRP